MKPMKFQFTIQPFQTDAVNAVVDVFDGQPCHDRFTYRRDMQKDKDLWEMKNKDTELGFANAKVVLDGDELLQNIHRIQSRGQIQESPKLITAGLGACALDVEMETGTGKTYVYIKTMFELNKHYGWSKFIVVVPSIAIREGVRKSFATMEDHFMAQYGKKAQYFIYDSGNLSALDNFSQSADIQVMIINMQAFNSSLNEEKNKEGRSGDKAARIIYSERDSFGSRRPIDVIAANHPILILDEPQKMGGEKTQKALRQFQPLFALHYSATHKDRHNMVYVLDALDAYQKKLVKRIEVKGIEAQNLQGREGYLYLEEIIVSPTHAPQARMEFEVRQKSSIKRVSRILESDDSLFDLSGSLEEYRGYRISDVNPMSGIVSFTNGIHLHTGEVTGDISEKDLRRIQIRETIRSHLAKERQLFDKGIKVLSLFFIDEVARYRQYDAAGEEVNGEYGRMFEEEYQSVLNEQWTLFDDDTPYGKYLQEIAPHATHAGYFSIDKKGRKVDSKGKGKEAISDDVSAYDLIMKDKELLLSLDNPVRFIFSHSALREGWDNPNVFQICTLKHGGDSSAQKRQEVGRGLRLCVNQKGERMDASVLGDQVQEVNLLTVIASEGYESFVKGLQKGIEDVLYERPKAVSMDYFAGKTFEIDGKAVTVKDEQARVMYNYLIRNGYIDDDGKVTDAYRQDAAQGTLTPVPDTCKNLEKELQAMVQHVYDSHAMDGIISNGHDTKVKENALNENFKKKEFQTLWQYINHKYAYTVEFDSNELIEKAVHHINEKLFVSRLQYKVVSGLQKEDMNRAQLEKKEGFMGERRENLYASESAHSTVRYDLVGQIAKGTSLTRKTTAAILSHIHPGKFALFRENPEEFMEKTIRLINEEKATMIVEHISYDTADGTYDSSIFTEEKNNDFNRAYQAKKNVQDYVFTDGYAKGGKSVERRFAEDLDKAAEVCVYAKLPKGFYIPTPVGHYSPDWAIAFYKGTVKHIFFVAETKGTMDSLNLKPIEQAKISCARKLFARLSNKDVVYDSVDSYQQLLNIMGKD